MNNTKKRNNIIKLACCLLIAITSMSLLINVHAEEVDFTTSNTVKTSKKVLEKELDGGVKYNVYKTVAYNSGNIDENNTNDFTVSWLDSASSSAVMANWSSTSLLKWSGQKVTSLMTDYERKNPGYLVVGGINGDFFHIQTTCEVMNVCMQEGNLVKPWQWRSRQTGVLGWTKDGRLVVGEPLASDNSNLDPEISSNMFLEKLDEKGEKVSEKNIASANQNVSEEGITLLTENNASKEFNLVGYKGVVVKYKMYRNAIDGNSKNDRLYVRGLVSEIIDNLDEKQTVPEYSVLLVSKDNSLDEYAVGDDLRMQYHLLGKWADVVNCAGYHDQILKDGESLFYQAKTTDYNGIVTDPAYINCSKNRTIVGSRPDGSTVYMTIEYNKNSKKSQLGASYYECAEYLKKLGCTNGWLLDGGGSTTLAVRDGLSPKLVAGASDGSERPDGNALLMVIKDPGVYLEFTEKRHSSFTFHIAKNDNFGIHALSNLKLTLNGKTVDCEVDGTYTFDNLEDETEYAAVLSYNLNGSNETEQLTRYITTAKYNNPEITCEINQVSDTACLLTPSMYLYKDNTKVENPTITVNNKEYPVVDKEPIFITGLTPNTEYKITYSVTSTDECNKKTYHAENIENKDNVFTTSDVAKPIVLDFKINRLTEDICELGYKYYDINNSVTSMYVEYFGIKEEIELNAEKEGTYIVEGVDPVNDEFIFTFNLVYSTGTVTSNSVSTNGVTIETTPPPSHNDDKSGCGSSSAIIVLITISLSTMFYFVKKH